MAEPGLKSPFATTPHSLSLGQKPNRRSVSKLAVVLHQSKSSERPSVVQAE